MNEQHKLDKLKSLVGDDVFNTIVSTGKSLEAKATKLGLKFKEGQMSILSFEEWQAQRAEYKEYQEFVAQSSEPAADFSEEELDAIAAAAGPDVVEKEMDYKMMASEVAKAMRPMIEAFMKPKKDEEVKVEVEEEKGISEVAELKALVAELTTQVKELQTPVAPSFNGIRATQEVDPQKLAAYQQEAQKGISHHEQVIGDLFA